MPVDSVLEGADSCGLSPILIPVIVSIDVNAVADTRAEPGFGIRFGTSGRVAVRFVGESSRPVDCRLMGLR